MLNLHKYGKTGCPPFITFTQCWHLQLFSEKTVTMQQNQSHQIDEEAHGEGTFSTQISHKKLIKYPLNPKISRADLGISPPFVPVKEHHSLYLGDTLWLHFPCWLPYIRSVPNFWNVYYVKLFVIQNHLFFFTFTNSVYHV